MGTTTRALALGFGLIGCVGASWLAARLATNLAAVTNPSFATELQARVAAGHADAVALEKEIGQLARLVYGLMGGAVLGAVGCAAVFLRTGWLAAPLLLTAFVAPIALSEHRLSAENTFPLILGAALAAFVRPQRPRPEPTPATEPT